MNTRDGVYKSSGLLIMSLVVINLTIIFISYWYFVLERKAFINQKVNQLNSIADIKRDQIIDWRNERLSDAKYLEVSPQITEFFRFLSVDRNNRHFKEVLHSNLNGMFLNGKYECMVAVDEEGKPFFSIPEMVSFDPSYYPPITQVNNTGRILISDIFYRDSISFMQIAIPEFRIDHDDSVYIGSLVLTINLEKSFFPLLEEIPIPSKTLEVIVLFKENNSILHLNRKNLPPIDIAGLQDLKGKRALASLKAVKGFTGTQEGLDHRGIPVLATSVSIPESKAFLLVKIDKSEAYSEVRDIKISTAVLTILMILALTSSISFFWLKQRNELMALESEKRMILERFDMLSRFANDAIIVYTKDLTILQVNDKALELYGYSRPELLGMGADLLRPLAKRDELASCLETTIKEGGFRFDTLHITKNGTVFPVEVSLRYMEMMGNMCFQALVRDITQRKQFEKALIASEERLRLITNTMPHIVWTAQPDGNFDFVNSRFEVLTGLIPLKENSVSGFFHPHDEKRVIDYWKKSIHSVTEHQIRFRLRMKDGSYRWFLCSAIPLCNDEGNVIKWYGSATDIDELENLVAQRTAELSDLYNNAPCGYHSLDIHGTFIKINDTELKWLGYSREEIIGKRNFIDLITPESQEAFQRNFKIFLSRGYVNNLAYDMVRKDGTLLPVLLTATAVKDKDDRIVMTRTTIIDHTDRKHHENEILKLNAILQQHGYDLEYTNKELEAFIFSVSHDLRAPLRAINGFSQILLNDYQDKFDTVGLQMLQNVWVNADKMKNLIEDLLRLSRTGRQELSYTSIDMSALFNSLIEEVRQIYPDREVIIKMSTLHNVYGDLALLKQVISNLLSNAVKFSGKMSVSQIEIGSLNGEEEISYSVKDNGAGFDMKYVHELFGVFRRLNNAEDYEGTGVGLALVKRIIDKHGGRVWAMSEPGHGATFYFSLPVKNVSSQ